jgi:hypothetical protein
LLVSLGLVLASQSGQAGGVGWYGESAAVVPAPAMVVAARPASERAAEVGYLAPDQAPVLATPGRLAVQGQPSIDLATVRRVLREYNSPALGDAEAFIELGQQYGIDPAICLAFFIVESGAGTKGVATETRSVGNIRATTGYVNHRGYRKYASWRDGIDDWYRLIARLYIDEWNLTTVEAIVPVYAPAQDGNDPHRYVDTVRSLVTRWRNGQ